MVSSDTLEPMPMLSMRASMASTELEAMRTGSWGDVGVRGGVSAPGSVAADELSVPKTQLAQQQARKKTATDLQRK
jgi:hypothetical protein